MDVSVIIVNYNTVNLVKDAVTSVIEKTAGISYEIIVVDNNSSDHAAIILKETFGNKIQYLQLPDNIGFGRANNEGIKIATGRNIFFLNPDTILVNNAIKILSEYLDKNTGAGACGGNLLSEKMDPIHSYRMLLPSIAEELNILLGQIPEKLFWGKNRQFNHSSKTKKVAYITGADLMIKKSIFEQTGIFKPEYFMYYEETDLCFRIKKLGYEIVSVPNAEIIHLEGKSFSTDAKNTRKAILAEKSRITFFRLNYPSGYQKIANQIHLIYIKSRIMIFSKNKEKRNFWEAVLNTFRTEQKQ